jgi:putative ABC transport system permease protein
MGYSLAILWYDRQRFVPAMLAVMFSALLVSLQFGLLLGTFSIVSIPIDNTSADIWVGQPGVVSVDVGETIPERWRNRLDVMPEVVETEPYIQMFFNWSKPHGGMENSIIIGSRLHDGALGAVKQLTPDLRAKLAEPGAVVVDEADLERLGLTRGVGETAQVGGNRVRVVGLVRGLKGLGGPYIFCSIETARRLMHVSPDDVNFVLARCRNPQDAARVVQRLHCYSNMSAFTSQEFSFRSRWYWLVMSGGGIALGCAALLGLLVGAVVTSQTLYAATAASFREYGVLRALGVPRWRLGLIILAQSFWLGVIGVLLAIPVVFGLAQLAGLLGARVFLPAWVLGSAAGLTLTTALLAGLTALRSLRQLQLATLLR